MKRILLVEDNASISEALAFAAERAGYQITIADTIKKAKALVANESFGLALLDVTLPDGNGFDFYRDTVSPSGIPAIFLTAKDEENDIVNGLSMGAEDYITKPFSTKELLARVNRVFMRQTHNNVVTAGEISFDLDKMELRKCGTLLSFSSLEIKILHLLFQNHDKAVRRSTVIDLIWKETGNDVYDHTVTVYMKRIKDKLGVDLITTIKGVGYRIDTKEGHE